ncbi:hypothetical protein L1887_56331 [Cichorium endivia]|nr:hypothetical protein L1887_56331 [Cichorium endivia]
MSFEQVCRQSWESKATVNGDAHSSTSDSRMPSGNFRDCYVDLWLFAMREFPYLQRPLHDGTPANVECRYQRTVSAKQAQLASTAFALGFETDKIKRTKAGHATSVFQPGQISLTPELSCHDPPLKWKARRNRPLSSNYARDKDFLHRRYIFDTSNFERKSQATSFAMAKNLVHCCWGSGLEQQEPDPKSGHQTQRETKRTGKAPSRAVKKNRWDPYVRRETRRPDWPSYNNLIPPNPFSNVDGYNDEPNEAALSPKKAVQEEDLSIKAEYDTPSDVFKTIRNLMDTKGSPSAYSGDGVVSVKAESGTRSNISESIMDMRSLPSVHSANRMEENLPFGQNSTKDLSMHAPPARSSTTSRSSSMRWMREGGDSDSREVDDAARTSDLVQPAVESRLLDDARRSPVRQIGEGAVVRKRKRSSQDSTAQVENMAVGGVEGKRRASVWPPNPPRTHNLPPKQSGWRKPIFGNGKRKRNESKGEND